MNGQEREIMKRHNVKAATIPVTGTRRHIHEGILVLLGLIIFGCATAPKPVIIKHQNAPYQGSASVSRTQNQKDTADGSSTSLVELLKKKNIISADEAARFTKEGGAVTSSEDVAALVELLKKKNVVSADEAGRFVKKSGTQAVPEKIAADASKTTTKEQSGKTPASVSEEMKEDTSDQVRNDEQEEVSSEAAEAESDKEPNEKTPAGVSEEMKEDSAEPEQKDVSPAATTRIDDAQVDEIMDGVKEELKSDIHEQVYNQVKEMLGKELPGELKKTDLTPFLPDWMKRIRLFADARLRYEYVSYDKQNFNEFTVLSQGTDTQTLQNTWADTDSFKYRIRFGVESINPYVDAVIRLSTGSTTNPISTNTLLGDYLNKDTVVFDLAYVKLKPWNFLSIYGGRMPNPWFSTDLVWDTDLNFEGLAIAARNPVKQSLVPYLTIGAFPLQQSGPTSTLDFSQHNKWLYAAQTGLEIKNTKGISAQAGAAYYHFNNITGELNETLRTGATDWSSPMYNQRGNTIFYIDPLYSKKFGLASEFKEVNITGALDIGFWDPVHVVFTGDYVRNIGFNKDDVAARTGLAEPEQAIDGYKIGLSVGYPKTQEFGQWKASLNYKYLGRDAVVDAFTDSDFSLGTNAQGWILGAEIGLTKNMWLTTRWVSTNEIDGPPLAIDLFQVDLNVSF